jgi:hypothetical protein
MKQKDLLMVLLLVVIFLPFFIFDPLYQLYSGSNAAHPYIWSFIKFAVLATIGECIGLRIRTGNYYTKGFGILPRAFVWGILGLMIKAAFVIFAAGAPMMLASLGVKFPAELPNPGAILSQSIFVSHSWLQVLAAFTFSATMNVFFAPMFMTLHKITDAHIGETGGSIVKFFTHKIRFGYHLKNMNWDVMWGFVFTKTIVFFWIPAHTINFLLPPEFRVLVAAILGIVLGIILAVAAVMGREKQK